MLNELCYLLPSGQKRNGGCALCCPRLYPLRFCPFGATCTLPLCFAPEGQRFRPLGEPEGVNEGPKRSPPLSPKGNNNEVVVANSFTPSGGIPKGQLVRCPFVLRLSPPGKEANQRGNACTLPLWGKTEGGKALCCPILYPRGGYGNANRRG